MSCVVGYTLPYVDARYHRTVDKSADKSVDMSHLDLALLGSPEVRYADQVLAFRTRKALALLIYLAVEGGHHSRPAITALFWPESDAAHGRSMLRTTLTHVHRALQQSAHDLVI